MKKVLLICHEYVPENSAITNCVIPLINKMSQRGINIDILTRRQNFSTYKHSIIDNVNVYRINDYFNIFNNLLKNEQRKSYIILYKILRKIAWIYRTKIKKIKDGFLPLDKSVKVADRLYNKNKYDTVISFSYPFTMHKIAYSLRKKYNLVWVAYQFDPHTYNFTFDEKYINERLNEEIDILKKADKIFINPETYKVNLKTGLKILKNKYEPLSFALISPSKKTVKKNRDKKYIVITFTGTFYEKIRNPFEMLDFIFKSDFNYKIYLYYIAEQAIENKLNEYKENYKEKFILFPRRSKAECDKAILYSDILINLGNSMNNQTPSKIFEFISLGKPIVNFYTISDDTSKSVLDKYSLKLNINLNNYTSEDIKNFKEFCLKYSGKTLDYDQIIKNYKTAEQIASDFIRKIDDIYENRKNKK